MTTEKGTLAYMAPEIFNSISYGPEGVIYCSYDDIVWNKSNRPSNCYIVDVYSFGMTVWVISQGDGAEPFQPTASKQAIAQQVVSGGTNYNSLLCLVILYSLFAHRTSSNRPFVASSDIAADTGLLATRSWKKTVVRWHRCRAVVFGFEWWLNQPSNGIST